MRYAKKKQELLNNKYLLVTDRLEIVERLISSYKNFLPEHQRVFPELYNIATTSYEHYEGLVNYLLLTCFDILGQPDQWIDYGSWLRSKKHARERKQILATIDINLSPIEISIILHEHYNSIYGVKNSFFRFLREILNEDQRHRLYNTISASNSLGEVYVQNGMVTRTSHKRPPIEFNIPEKEKLLYTLRNAFTHKCMSCHNGTGMYPFSSKRRLIPVYQDIKEDSEITYFVHNWPNILIDIIKEVLSANKDKMPYFHLDLTHIDKMYEQYSDFDIDAFIQKIEQSKKSK